VVQPGLLDLSSSRAAVTEEASCITDSQP
jgi:hypothetical protein